MSQSIPQAFVIQWDAQMRMLAQQKDSRLLNAVTNRGTVTGESFTINDVGQTDLPENTVRHGDTEWGEIDHTTRVIPMRDYFRALPVDRNDEAKLIANPLTTGTYAQSLVAAKNRRIDDIIYAAMIGTVTQKDGSTVSLPAGQKIAGGGTGFTKAKIIQARSLFRKNEADDADGDDELYATYNDLALQQVLTDTTLTSADFMAIQMLQAGSLKGKWLGFNWIPFQRLNATATPVYTAAFWAKSGVHFGTGFEVANAVRRPDKKDLMQVSYAGSYGAGRQDEAKVVTLDFQ